MFTFSLRFPLGSGATTAPVTVADSLADDVPWAVATAVAAASGCSASDVSVRRSASSGEGEQCVVVIDVWVRASGGGGKGGFGRQLRIMGKEFRAQRQLAQRARRSAGPGNAVAEGVYRDSAGRRVVVVAQPPATAQPRSASANSKTIKQAEAGTAPAPATVAGGDTSDSARSALRDAAVDARRSLVMKILAAVREGIARVEGGHLGLTQ
jgi:hypothetical protein